MSVRVASEPWGSSLSDCLNRVPFCLGPMVYAEKHYDLKYNGRNLPFHSKWIGKDCARYYYSLPFITSVSGKDPLPLSWKNGSIPVKLLGVLKNPLHHSQVEAANEECGGVHPRELLSFLNEAVSLFDELYLCAEFVAGRKTAGNELFRTIASPRKEDFRKGKYEWRRLPWKTVSQLVLQEQHEPRYDLIVRIAQEFSDELSKIAKKPRKILRRVRKKTALSRVQQMDATCLAWLVRQPGRSAIEKAGAAQQIYSIVREEFFDTLENQVLKQFLKLCIRHSKDYLKRNPEYEGTDRFKLVKRFSALCQILLKASVFDKISALHHIPQPNFVLQGDPSYSKLWGYYLQILHREKELEELWRWQHLLWADLMRVFLSSAIYELARSEELPAEYMCDSLSCIRQKSVNGSRIYKTAWPKGLLYNADKTCPIVLDCFSSQELYKSDLPVAVKEIAARSGAMFFCYFTAVGRSIEEHVLLSVWSFHGPVEDEQRTTVQTQSQRAAKVLADLQSSTQSCPRMRGFIFRSSFAGDDGRDIPRASIGSITVEGLRVPVNPNVWRKDLLPLISQLIGECVIMATERASHG